MGHVAEEALREETRALATLNRIASATVAEKNLERIVQLVTDAGVELTGAEVGAFFYNVADRSGESYMLYSLSGVPREAFARFPMPRNTAIFAPTFRGEGVVRSDDIKADPRYGHNAPNKGMPEGHLPVTSHLAVPVISREGEVIGGLFSGILRLLGSQHGTRRSLSASPPKPLLRSKTRGSSVGLRKRTRHLNTVCSSAPPN